MAVFPKKQVKAQEELDRVIGPTKKLSLEQKSQVPYLRKLISLHYFIDKIMIFGEWG